jgi:hypothetical protein
MDGAPLISEYCCNLQYASHFEGGEQMKDDNEKTPKRRRAEDVNAPAQDESSETLLSRSRRLAGKYGKPLIGLGVAGVAMPIAHALDNAAAQHQQHTTMPQPGQAPKVNVVERQTPAATGSQAAREDNLGQHWNSLKRGNIVQSAMQAFGIDQGLAEKIHDFAVQAGIEPQLGYGLVHTESTFKPTAKSYVGALGLTQLMPRTAAWLQPGTSKADLVIPDVNLPLGFKYLKSLIDRYNGDTRMALLAYNRGPGIVDRVLKHGGDPNNGYADKVLGGAGRVQGGHT